MPPRSVAFTWSQLADVLDRQGDGAAARRAVEKAVRAADGSGDPVAVAQAHGVVANLRDAAGDAAGAREEYRRCADAALAASHARLRAFRVVNLARAALLDGDFDAALPLVREAVDIVGRLGPLYQATMARCLLADALRGLGDDEGAAAQHRHAISDARDYGSHGLAFALVGLATVVDRSSPELAARLLGEADALVLPAGMWFDPYEETARTEALSRLEAALGLDRLAALRAEGRETTLVHHD